MKKCFDVLGLDEKATRAQIQEAYDRRVTRYNGDLYAEDPKYVKRKLKELRQAYEEAYRLAESAVTVSEEGYADDINPDFEENLESLLTDEEMHMQKLYHKHLHRRVDKAAGIYPDGLKGQRKENLRYKGNVMLFWLGILVVIVGIGMVITLIEDVGEIWRFLFGC